MARGLFDEIPSAERLATSAKVRLRRALFSPMKKLFTLLFSLVAAVVVMAAETSLTGVWKVDSDTAGNVSVSTLTLKQDGKTITGTLKGPDDQAVPLSGEFDGKNVTWHYKAEWSGNELNITYKGTLDANGVITGSIDVQPMGIEGSFTAKRAEAAK